MVQRRFPDTESECVFGQSRPVPKPAGKPHLGRMRRLVACLNMRWDPAFAERARWRSVGNEQTRQQSVSEEHGCQPGFFAKTFRAAGLLAVAVAASAVAARCGNASPSAPWSPPIPPATGPDPILRQALKGILLSDYGLASGIFNPRGTLLHVIWDEARAWEGTRVERECGVWRRPAGSLPLSLWRCLLDCRVDSPELPLRRCSI